MTLPLWPYVGLAPVPFGPVPTAAQLDLMREQLATAADGRVWGDVALWKNVVLTSSQTTGRTTMLWEPTREVFLSFGNVAGNPSGVYSVNGRIWTTISGLSAGAGLTPHFKSADHNGAGVVVVGGTPGSSSVQKYRRSADGGVAWAIQNSTFSNTAGVQTVRWVPAFSLWVAGLTDGTLETSPDGITWTARTHPNSSARSEIAIGDPSGSPLAVMGNTNNPNVITSPDGINWTNRSLGVGSNTNTVIWSAKHLKFFTADNSVGKEISSSVDGITWTQAGLTEPGNSSIQRIVEFDRVIVGIAHSNTTGTMAGYYSLDGCQSWLFLNHLDVDSFQSMAFSERSRQAIFTDAAGLHYMTLAAGF